MTLNMKNEFEFGSLFSGAGGMDYGFEKSGMKCKWQFETNNQVRWLLKKHFQAKLYGDVGESLQLDLETVRLICGGDPCPVRSRAKGNRKSNHPDLSGWFLALVGKMRPRWVVRENVPAPDDKDFTTALEMLGYGTVIIRANAVLLTGQNRIRDFIVGCAEKPWMRKFIELSKRQNGYRFNKAEYNPSEGYPCLTTHRCRYDARDGYIWDGKFRIADKDERTKLAGFPSGWFDGLSETAVAKLCGNAVVPEIAEWIGKRILEAEHARK